MIPISELHLTAKTTTVADASRFAQTALLITPPPLARDIEKELEMEC